jgi:hypothetical protein
MSDADKFAGVSSAEWLAWLQRIDGKLDRFLDRFAHLDLPPFKARDDLDSRLAILRIGLQTSKESSIYQRLSSRIETSGQ